jgi:hypothetical protein
MDGSEKLIYIGLLREKYRRSGKKKKGDILDEAVSVLGISRKHAIRLFGSKGCGRPKKPGKGGRPGKYQDPDFKSGLKLCWRVMRYPCGRILKEGIPDWLGFIEAEYGAFQPEVREKLLAVSSATIDRILKGYKVEKGKSFTRSTGFRDEIPIQENIWDINIPGYIESDTVAHCGGSLSGEFVNTLTIVDIATIWTEARVIFGRGSNAAFDALKVIEASLPFPILGYDADNGGEVLNRTILSYFRDERIEQGREPVQVTRSRAYKKNDNAHVEQRNDSIARRYLGYERIDFKELVPLINYYYSEIVCPLQNHFFPTFKLKDKVRVKSRTKRIYDKPVTPYSRVMNSEHVPVDFKERLSKQHQNINPVKLVKLEKLIRKQIDQALKQLRLGMQPKIHVPETVLTMAIQNQKTYNIKLKKTYKNTADNKISRYHFNPINP